MLTLTGTLRAATRTKGGTDRRTGEIRARRNLIQVETLDGRGMVNLHTMSVPDLAPFEGKVGQAVTLPVRAYSLSGPVALSYDGAEPADVGGAA